MKTLFIVLLILPALAWSSSEGLTDSALHTSSMPPDSSNLANFPLVNSQPVKHSHLGIEENFVSLEKSEGSFPVFSHGKAAPLWLDADDWPGVRRAARDLRSDVQKVSSVLPNFSESGFDHPPSATPIIIGTLGRSRLIDQLVASDKIDVSGLKGKWESFSITTVDEPFEGVERAFVIAGSDKRGTIYGIYEVSEQLGVSPWYWWADVPIKKRDAAFVQKGTYSSGEPAVQYRGIFLNDEAPALTGWSTKTFGGRNSKFYAHVFELILRLRGNYLWPAMWGDAFAEDDPQNPVLADEYGIVMGTSHHEPMMRAHKEWTRNKKDYGNGEWSYLKNEKGVKKFFREGIQQHKDFENIITLAMRGDGDEGLREANVELLERVVADQRKIIAEETGSPAHSRPQVWSLYKEVQDYYEQGMKVPDDVTLLWCDDNWGNIRRLPDPKSTRKGGSGVYYHFDYVGGPRSYRWINTNPLPRIQEQMSLAADYGANKIWIVNVGDLKPMEVPTEFFLRMAWDPARWTADKLDGYLLTWSTREFGAENAAEAADLIAKYTKYNHWRKPELLEPGTFSLVNYREAERVVEQWNTLVERAENLFKKFPQGKRDHIYQLIVHPIKAAAAVNNLYYKTALNHLYASQERASTNLLAEDAKNWFTADAELTRFWNQNFANGKWIHMMDQSHIGYTSWNAPDKNIMPALKTYAPPKKSKLGVAIEGFSEQVNKGDDAVLPTLYFKGGSSSRYIEIYNKGATPSRYTIRADKPWLTISHTEGKLTQDVRSEIRVADWSLVPEGKSEVIITVEGEKKSSRRLIRLPLEKSDEKLANKKEGFLDLNGYVAIEALHYDRVYSGKGVSWKKHPDLGRGTGALSPFPTIFKTIKPTSKSARLEYDIYFSRGGEITVDLLVSPTLNFIKGQPLRYAIAIDDEKPQIVEFAGVVSDASWADAVRDSVRRVSSFHQLPSAGFHTLKVWAVDPGLVLQRIEIDTGGMKPSYLGPPESPRGRRLAVHQERVDVGAMVVVEAESGRLGKEFELATNAPESISITSDAIDGSPKNKSRIASYKVKFKQAGKYKLYARVLVGEGGADDDSIYIPKKLGKAKASKSGDWKTANSLVGVGFTKFTDRVDAGINPGSAGKGVWKWIDFKTAYDVPENRLTQVFQIGGRETGFHIDKFVFALEDRVFTVGDLSQGAAGQSVP